MIEVVILSLVALNILSSIYVAFILRQVKKSQDEIDQNLPEKQTNEDIIQSNLNNRLFEIQKTRYSVRKI